MGLTQILAETGTGLLGMQVDVERERAAHAEARRARAGRARPTASGRSGRGSTSASTPTKALAATGRYLAARDGRVRPRGPRGRLVPHGHRQPPEACSAPTATTRRATRSSTSTPRPTATRARTGCSPGLGDDSKTYLWRVLASREIMRLYREDRDELGRLAELQRRWLGELVRRPPDLHAFERGGRRRGSRRASCAPWERGRGVRAPGVHPRRGAQTISGVKAAAAGRANGAPGTTPRHRLRLRHQPRLRERRPGGGVPVHARPAPGAQPDRVDARRPHDPRHRLERGRRLLAISRRASASARPPSRARGSRARPASPCTYCRSSRSERRNRCSSASRCGRWSSSSVRCMKIASPATSTSPRRRLQHDRHVAERVAGREDDAARCRRRTRRTSARSRRTSSPARSRSRPAGSRSRGRTGA